MSEAIRVEIAGEPLRCKHCGADVFHQTSAALDRLALGGLFHLEGWLGQQATIYVCSACGFLHWFFDLDAAPHDRIDAAEADERIECLSCGRAIPMGDESCPACGWSWKPADAGPT